MFNTFSISLLIYYLSVSHAKATDHLDLLSGLNKDFFRLQRHSQR